MTNKPNSDTVYTAADCQPTINMDSSVMLMTGEGDFIGKHNNSQSYITSEDHVSVAKRKKAAAEKKAAAAKAETYTKVESPELDDPYKICINHKCTALDTCKKIVTLLEEYNIEEAMQMLPGYDTEKK